MSHTTSLLPGWKIPHHPEEVAPALLVTVCVHVRTLLLRHKEEEEEKGRHGQKDDLN